MRIPILILCALALSGPSRVVWAFDLTTRLTGCEAAKMKMLLEPSGRAEWRGDRRAVGAFSFTSLARIACSEGDCEIGVGLEAKRDGSDLPRSDRAAAAYLRQTSDGRVAIEGLSVVLATSPIAGQSLRRVQGTLARELIDAMGHGSFLGPDGRKHNVWMDYGDVNGITIRARTSLSCAIEPEVCDVFSETLVFVSD